jgi:hypothetical protein
MDEVWNSYSVRFVFDNTTITTTVMALHEDAAEYLAADVIYEDLGFSDLSTFLHSEGRLNEIEVELVDVNVGMGMK